MTEDEIWLPVKTWEGYYEISSFGRVRSLERVVTESSGKKRIKHEKILNCSHSGNDYYRVQFHASGRHEYARVHKLVAEHFLVRKEKDQVIRHLDGNPKNNNVKNLAWGTYAENLQDAVNHGTAGHLIKTHCKQGHEYTEENIYRTKTQRICKICMKQRSKKWKAEHKDSIRQQNADYRSRKRQLKGAVDGTQVH